jgi:ribosomal protein S18 acetylase RimI-like enzyme
MSDGVVIEEAVVADGELVAAIRRLLPLLSSSAPPVEAFDVETLVNAPATQLLVARVNGQIVGTLTLAIFRIPSGVRAWIEDVIVDEEARGHGVGAALCHEAIRRAGLANARTVDLTSNPKREAANAMYRKLGFVQRETNVYRFSLSG